MALLSPASLLGLLCGECPGLLAWPALAAGSSTCHWGKARQWSVGRAVSSLLDQAQLPSHTSPHSRGSGLGLGGRHPPWSWVPKKEGLAAGHLAGPDCWLLLCHFFALLIEKSSPGPLLPTEGFHGHGCVRSTIHTWSEERSGLIISTLQMRNMKLREVE